MKVYKKAGYMRFYMLLCFGFVGMGSYLNFKRNKRKPLHNLELAAHVRHRVKDNKEVMSLLREQILFDETTEGAIIDDRADFRMNFAGFDYSGLVDVKASYDQETMEPSYEVIDVSLFDKQGQLHKRLSLL